MYRPYSRPGRVVQQIAFSLLAIVAVVITVTYYVSTQVPFGFFATLKGVLAAGVLGVVLALLDH
jgi:hypothetical protein